MGKYPLFPRRFYAHAQIFVSYRERQNICPQSRIRLTVRLRFIPQRRNVDPTVLYRTESIFPHPSSQTSPTIVPVVHDVSFDAAPPTDGGVYLYCSKGLKANEFNCYIFLLCFILLCSYFLVWNHFQYPVGGILEGQHLYSANHFISGPISPHPKTSVRGLTAAVCIPA